MFIIPQPPLINYWTTPLSLALWCFAYIFPLSPQKILWCRNYDCYFIGETEMHRKFVTRTFIVYEGLPPIFTFMCILTVILIPNQWIRGDIVTHFSCTRTKRLRAVRRLAKATGMLIQMAVNLSASKSQSINCYTVPHFCERWMMVKMMTTMMMMVIILMVVQSLGFRNPLLTNSNCI